MQVTSQLVPQKVVGFFLNDNYPCLSQNLSKKKDWLFCGMLSVWLLLLAYNGNTCSHLTDGRKMLAESSFIQASELFLKQLVPSCTERSQHKAGLGIAVVCRQPASFLGCFAELDEK